MIRTQVYLPKQLYQTIDLVAKRERKPKAQVIRDMLESGIMEKQGNSGEALLDIARLGRKLKLKGPRDLSKNIDKYLYEDA